MTLTKMQKKKTLVSRWSYIRIPHLSLINLHLSAPSDLVGRAWVVWGGGTLAENDSSSKGIVVMFLISCCMASMRSMLSVLVLIAFDRAFSNASARDDLGR